MEKIPDEDEESSSVCQSRGSRRTGNQLKERKLILSQYMRWKHFKTCELSFPGLAITSGCHELLRQQIMKIIMVGKDNTVPMLLLLQFIQ